MSESATPSIHHQRRWYYVLWSGLVLLSLACLLLWNRPAEVEHPRLGLKVLAEGLPERTTLEVWLGPRKAWESGSGGPFQPLRADGRGAFVLEAVELAFPRRRFVDRVLIPGRGHELLVLRATAPGEAPRHLFLSLKAEWYAGALRPGKRTVYVMRPVLKGLDPSTRIPADVP
ncbi:MAG: hypothetical protein U0P81_02280 [Holophagaceae bacterium]